jgi:hypothetical protein
MLGIREPVQCLDFEDPWPLPELEELEPEEWVGFERGPLPVTLGPPLPVSFAPPGTLWWG